MEMDLGLVTQGAVTGGAVYAAIRVHIWHIMRQIARQELVSDDTRQRLTLVEIDHEKTKTKLNYIINQGVVKHV